MMKNGVRHEPCAARNVPIGAPNATATVIPPITVAMARPRIAGGTMATATAFAVGVKTPAARPSRMRTRNRTARLSASPASALASRENGDRADQHRLSRRAGQSVARIGEPIA